MFMGGIRVQGKPFRLVTIFLSVAALVLVACSGEGPTNTPTAVAKSHHCPHRHSHPHDRASSLPVNQYELLG